MSSWKTALPASASASAGCSPGHSSGQVVAKGPPGRRGAGRRAAGRRRRCRAAPTGDRPRRTWAAASAAAARRPCAAPRASGAAAPGAFRPTRPRACAAPSRCPRRTATPRPTSRVRARARMSAAAAAVQPGSPASVGARWAADAWCSKVALSRRPRAARRARAPRGRLRSWTSPAGRRSCPRSSTRRRCPAASSARCWAGRSPTGAPSSSSAAPTRRRSRPTGSRHSPRPARRCRRSWPPPVTCSCSSGWTAPPDWAGLGRAVARLHRTTGPRFGWHRDNSGGRIAQHNGWHDDWPTFFVENRVRVHLADPAVPDALRRRLERACAGPLPELLPDAAARVADPRRPVDGQRGRRALARRPRRGLRRPRAGARVPGHGRPARGVPRRLPRRVAAGPGLPAAPSGAAAAQAAGEPAALRRAVRPARSRRCSTATAGSQGAR